MIDYKYLSSFLVLYECRNFTIAAEKLGVTQSALSIQIKKLEEEFSKQLFLRNPQSVIPTEEARLLYDHFYLPDLWAKKEFKEFRESTIKIASVQGFLETVFPGLITDTIHSKYSLDIYMQLPGEIDEGLIEGKTDFGFNIWPLDHKEFESVPIYNEEIDFISRVQVSLKDIHQYNWISCSENDYIFKLSRKRPKRIIHVDSVPAAIELVRRGVGVSAVPNHIIPKTFKGYRETISKFKNDKIYLIYRRYSHQPEHIADFLNSLDF